MKPEGHIENDLKAWVGGLTEKPSKQGVLQYLRSLNLQVQKVLFLCPSRILGRPGAAVVVSFASVELREQAKALAQERDIIGPGGWPLVLMRPRVARGTRASSSAAASSAAPPRIQRPHEKRRPRPESRHRLRA
jgi:hypothetical protein